MKRFMKLFALFFRANILILLQYRMNFLIGSISSIFWSVLSIIGIIIVTYNAPSLGGWNRDQLILVQGVYSIIFGISYFIFIKNFFDFSYLVRVGNLDFLFLKPVDSQFLASIGIFQTHSVIRILFGVIVIIYSLMKLHIDVSVFTVLAFSFFILLSVIIIYSIWFSVVTTSIWLVDLFNLPNLLSQITSVSRYPLVILRELSYPLMYIFLPLVVITTVPSQIIMNTTEWGLILWTLVLACLFFMGSRLFWKFSLRFYTSASS